MLYEQKEFIVIKNDRTLQNYFYNTKCSGICYREYDLNKNDWSNPMILVSNVKENYSIDGDSNGQLYILCTTENNAMKLLKCKNNKWVSHDLSNKSMVESIIEYPVVKVLGNVLHLFYVKLNLYANAKEKKSHGTIFHSFIENNKWQNIKIASLSSNFYHYPYILFKDDFNFLHLLYSFVPDNSRLKYTRFNSIDSTWSKETILRTCDTGCHNVDITVYDENHTHLSWVSLEQELSVINHTVIHYNIYSSKPDISIKSEKVYKTGLKSTNPFITSDNEDVYIFWKEDNKIVYTKNSSENNSWTQPVSSVNCSSCAQPAKFIENYDVEGLKSNIYKSYYWIDNMHFKAFDPDTLNTYKYKNTSRNNNDGRNNSNNDIETLIEADAYAEETHYQKKNEDFNQVILDQIKKLDERIMGLETKVRENTQNIDMNRNKLNEVEKEVKNNWPKRKASYSQQIISKQKNHNKNNEPGKLK